MTDKELREELGRLLWLSSQYRVGMKDARSRGMRDSLVRQWLIRSKRTHTQLVDIMAYTYRIPHHVAYAKSLSLIQKIGRYIRADESKNAATRKIRQSA